MLSKTLSVFLVFYLLSDLSHGQRAKKFFRSDYSYIEAVEGFYKIHSIPGTWAEAKRVCAQEGAIFWHPDDDNEAHAVASLWNTTYSHIGLVYVGLSDQMFEGLFETTEGKLVSAVYNNWEQYQPDDYGGKEDCAFITKEGSMGDCPCDTKHPFICKKSLESLEWNDHCNIPHTEYTFNEGTGKCYKFHTTPLNWIEAFAVCRLEQSSLVVITNRLEADYLVNLTESTPKPRIRENYQRGIYHVGFHNRFNEGWQTVNGKPTYLDADAWWDNYQPDGSDQCGLMFYTGLLINMDCNTKSFFICEHEPDIQNQLPLVRKCKY